MFRRTHRREYFRQLIECYTESSHARVDLEMDWVLRHAERCCRFIQRLDLPRLPHRRRKVKADNLVFLAAPEARHQQNAGANFRVSQWYRFIEGCDAKPACSLSFQGPRAFHRAMPVSVRLYHSTNRHSRANMFLYCTEILSQARQRHIGPRRTRRRAAQDFSCCRHFRDYSGSSRRAEVTLGLLPRVAAIRTSNSCPKQN